MSAPAMTTVLPIPADHAAFAGHFPGMPVLPGAVLIDAAMEHIAASRHLDLTRWRVTVKFLEVVRPGDVLTLEHEPGSGVSIRFSISTTRATVASGSLAAWAPAPQDADGA
jgi:3-hydroxymyristoyl/3-hydroxydecanoyl-(acyl carrier protein) dehydratase